MRNGREKDTIIRIVIGVVVSVVIGMLLAKDIRIKQAKETIFQGIDSGETFTITINSWLVPNNIVKQTIQEYNEQAKEDVCNVYQVEERTFWVSSQNRYKKMMAGFRINLAEDPIRIRQNRIWQSEITVTYATEQQEKEYRDSVLFWEDHIRENANMEITEEKRGEVTKVTVILTPKNFVEGEALMRSPVFLYSRKLH